MCFFELCASRECRHARGDAYVTAHRRRANDPRLERGRIRGVRVKGSAINVFIPAKPSGIFLTTKGESTRMLELTRRTKPRTKRIRVPGHSCEFVSIRG